jgi:hypothetical protein
MSTATERLGAVLETVNRPGTCEVSLVILKGMSVEDQVRAGMKYSQQIQSLSSKYARFAKEAPAAAQAAEDAIALGV